MFATAATMALAARSTRPASNPALTVSRSRLLPSATEDGRIAGAITRWSRQADATATQRSASSRMTGTNRRTSAAAHANLYAALSSPEEVPGGGGAYKITLDVGLLISAFTYALRVHEPAVGRLGELSGRSAAQWAADHTPPTL